MDRFVALEAITDHPRNEAIAQALEVLGAEGGFVTAADPLGGLALHLSFELPCEAARTLAARAAHVDIRLDAKSRDALLGATNGTDHVIGSLLLRFYAHEADVKIDVPKVPG